MAEKVPSWIDRLLIPRLSEISGEIKALNTKIEALGKRVDALEKMFDERLVSLRNEMIPRFEAVNTRIEALEKTMNTRIDALEKRIPIIEELAGIKARITELERKIAIKQG